MRKHQFEARANSTKIEHFECSDKKHSEHSVSNYLTLSMRGRGGVRSTPPLHMRFCALIGMTCPTLLSAL